MRKVWLFLGVLLMGTVPIRAVPTVTVRSSLAPNMSYSPSAHDFAQNVVTWFQAYLRANGNTDIPMPTFPDGPANFAPQNLYTDKGALINSDFVSSWMGELSNAVGPYANEMGTEINSPFLMKADFFNPIKLSNVRFAYKTPDGKKFNLLTTEPIPTYSPYNVGILKGPDGQLGTADDTLITSGSSDQLVNAIIGVGPGILKRAVDYPGMGQEQLDNVRADLDGFDRVFVNVYYGDPTMGLPPGGSNTVYFTPEPGSLLLMSLFGLTIGRRRSRA